MPAQRTSSLLGQSFQAISHFLRQGLADEDSRELREHLGELSQQIEALVTARRSRAPAPDLQQQAQALAQQMRAHQYYLTGLGAAWHALYEMDAYQRALHTLRQALDAWLQALAQHELQEARLFQQFEQRAWRTLGEAMLLVDMYEQGDTLHSEAAAPAPPKPWWRRLW